MIVLLLLSGAISSAVPAQLPAAQDKTIVLIGGNTPHGPYVHDYQDGIPLLAGYLLASPEIRAMKNVTIKAYPNGWPTDRGALDKASTVVWYFDGLEHHPMLDAGRRADFERLMRRGVGLVTFHQASTLLPADTSIPLISWLGAARYGMVDRTVETVAFTPANHPIARGVKPFAYRDEFYPTVRFGRDPVIPILTASLHLEAAPAAAPTMRTVAWAFERPGGGRSFGFTGFHYLVAVDQADLRKLLLNAILWTAGIEVPKEGVSAMPQAGERGVTLTRASETQRLQQPWGELRWFTSSELKNSASITTGEAVIRQGQETPRHFHPNSEEILRVAQGDILETVGAKTFEMKPGDVITIPEGVKHGSRNIGTNDAILSLSYPTAHRLTVGEAPTK